MDLGTELDFRSLRSFDWVFNFIVMLSVFIILNSSSSYIVGGIVGVWLIMDSRLLARFTEPVGDIDRLDDGVAKSLFLPVFSISLSPISVAKFFTH